MTMIYGGGATGSRRAPSTDSCATRGYPEPFAAVGTAPRFPARRRPNVRLTWSIVISRPRRRTGNGSPTSEFHQEYSGGLAHRIV